jgi:hypothetical protein
MSRYILIRRLRGPAVLLLIGVLALMDESGAISHFWGWFWPLLMILLGVLLLAERAAMSNEDFYPPPPYPGAPYQGPYQGVDPNAQPGFGQSGFGQSGFGQSGAAQPGTAIVPSAPSNFTRGGNGGQL